MSKETKEKPIVVGFWKRLISDIFDSIILGIFGAIIAFGFRSQLNHVGENGFWIGLVITFLYTGILQSSIGKGQSLAKKALKIQVLRKDGSYLSLQRSFLRYLIIALLFYNTWIGTSLISLVPMLNNDIFLTFYNYAVVALLIGTVFLVAFHPLKRGVHDLLVDSIVVRKGEYSKEKIQALENPKKTKIAFIIAVLLSVAVIGGSNYFFAHQDFVTPELIEELREFAIEIDDNTSFDNVSVMHNFFNDLNGNKTQGLFVEVFQYQNKFDDAKFTEAEVNKVVDIVKNYSDIQDCQYIVVNVRTGFNIGIAYFTNHKNFTFDEKGNVKQPNAKIPAPEVKVDLDAVSESKGYEPLKAPIEPWKEK